MPCGVDCVGASSGCAEALEPTFKIGFGSSIFRFLMDFEGFGEAKMDFWNAFFDVFFERDFGIAFG